MSTLDQCSSLPLEENLFGVSGGLSQLTLLSMRKTILSLLWGSSVLLSLPLLACAPVASWCLCSCTRLFCCNPGLTETTDQVGTCDSPVV